MVYNKQCMGFIWEKVNRFAINLETGGTYELYGNRKNDSRLFTG